MPGVTVELPPTLARYVADALTRHAGLPALPGVAVPGPVRRMTTGSIDSDDLRWLVHFYCVISPAAEREIAALRTEADSPVVRRWMLAGDYEGMAWANREYRRLVAARAIRPVRTLPLFRMTPEQVYEAFTLGAWRYAYGLTPRSAARFVEDYSLSTGRYFDVYRAFGADAESVVAARRRDRERRDPFRAAQRRVLRSALHESVDERYGGAVKARGIWYHGTAQRNLPSILSQGLIPDPKVRAWADDPDASATRASRASIGGIYLTQNLMTALSSATRDPASRFNPLIVAVSMTPRAAVFDEDSLRFTLEVVGPNHNVDGPIAVVPAFVEARTRLGAAARAKVAEWEADVAYHITGVDSQPDTLHPGLRARLQVLLADHFRATAERQAAHLALHRNGWSSFASDLIRYGSSTEYPESAFGQYTDDGFVYDPRFKPLDVATAERRWLASMDRITRALRKYVARHVAQSHSKTLRVLEPIRYSGSNRIVAVFSLKDDPQPRRDSLEGRETSGPSFRVVMHYGTLPDDAVKQLKERRSSKFDPRKHVVPAR